MGLDNPIHIAFLLILLLLVFGAKRLPEMGRSLGDGMRGFKDALSGRGAGTPSTQVAQKPAAQSMLTSAPAQPAAPAQLAAPLAVVQVAAETQGEHVPAA